VEVAALEDEIVVEDFTLVASVVDVIFAVEDVVFTVEDVVFIVEDVLFALEDTVAGEEPPAPHTNGVGPGIVYVVKV